QATGSDVSQVFVQSGTYQVALRVTDSNGGSAISQLTVTVHNLPPTANAGPGQTIQEGDTATFHGTATDPGAPPETLSYAWDFNYDRQTVVDGTGVADTTHPFVQHKTPQAPL